jgi:hypothetical protein
MRVVFTVLARVLIAGFGWSSFFDQQVQRSFGLHEQAYAFTALVRSGIFLQPFQQPLLSPKEFCDGGHLKEFCDSGHLMNLQFYLATRTSPLGAPVRAQGPFGRAHARAD